MISNAISRPSSPDVELGQEVRIDPLVSGDAYWDGATMTVYEQNLSFPTNGTYRSYGIVTSKAGDAAFVEFAGEWQVLSNEGRFVEAPFDGQGKILGGSGKLEGLSGTVVVKDTVTGQQVGTYSVELTADR